MAENGYDRDMSRVRICRVESLDLYYIMQYTKLDHTFKLISKVISLHVHMLWGPAKVVLCMSDKYEMTST